MLRICGPKLSNCCFILSLWGVIMLVLLGIFFKTKSVALLEDTNKSLSEEAGFSSSAKNCFIGAGIYGVTLIISIHQKWVNARTGDTQKFYKTVFRADQNTWDVERTREKGRKP